MQKLYRFSCQKGQIRRCRKCLYISKIRTVCRTAEHDPYDQGHFTADPHPSFHFNADPEHNLHFYKDPDPAPHQSDANLRPWSTDPPRLHFEPLKGTQD
jgi:hypothetical protein